MTTVALAAPLQNTRQAYPPGANNSPDRYAACSADHATPSHGGHAHGATYWPTNGWTSATPEDVGMNAELVQEAVSYGTLGNGSGYITRHGLLIASWGTPTTTRQIKSATKSVGTMLLGLAIKDQLVQLDDFAQLHMPDIGVRPPENLATGWLPGITLENLATHTAGFDKPGGYIPLLFAPATTWAYSDGGMNWLADVLTTVYSQDLQTLAFERIFTPLGLTSADVFWRNNFYRSNLLNGVARREFGSGISTHADALARLGYLMLRNGVWDGQAIIPTDYVHQSGTTVAGVVGLPVGNDVLNQNAFASNHYGLGWWNNADRSLPDVPADAYWAWGLGDNLIVVIPSLDIVASRTGSDWLGPRSPNAYIILEPFLSPIVTAVMHSEINHAPIVDAGRDKQATLPAATVHLAGTVTDDGLPSGAISMHWSVVKGPAAVSFGNFGTAITSAQFALPGTYGLRLSASDGRLTGCDEVVISISAE